MLDTQGPEIRLGSFANGEKEVELKAGSVVTLTTDASFRSHQTKDKLWVSYDKISVSAAPGSVILLDDGAIELLVKEVRLWASILFALIEVIMRYIDGHVGERTRADLYR